MSLLHSLAQSQIGTILPVVPMLKRSMPPDCSALLRQWSGGIFYWLLTRNGRLSEFGIFT